MRTAYRVLSTAVAVAAVIPFWALPAEADTAPAPVETAAWFWSQQTFGSGPNGVPYPAVPLSASGVPAGDLAVAYAGATETKEDGSKTSTPDKETYLAWDIYSVPEGSTVDSFTFTLIVDPAAHNVVPPAVAVPGQPTKGGQPAIVACAATIGFGAGEGDAFDVKPTDDCADQVFGQWDATKGTYSFDATTYAQDWVDGKDNFGLGIRPLEDASDPFQLSFLGAAKIVSTISYTPPAEEEYVPPVAPPVIAPPGPQVAVPVIQPVSPVPQPQPQAPPVVAIAKKPVVVQNVAASPLRASRGLSAAFWLAAAGGVMLLGAASLILGDPVEAVSAGRTRVRPGRHRVASRAGAAAPSFRPRIV